ncbi:MAG: hypothetical protein MUD17_08135 [Gemmatimonadaceae bacterium]|jgi:hypothetical protein|nr:hypothetical protein [Gemmatimonadaceae bacterium]
MSLITQVRQVLRRDARDARWLLLAYVVTLGYAIVQGRALLRPPALLGEASVLAQSPAFVPALLFLALLFLLSSTIALHFAPRVGRTSHDAQAWLTLPIAPEAVFAARMCWVLGAVLTSLLVTWLVLLPLPITPTTRLRTAGAIALNSGALLLAGTLLAIAAGSLRRLLLWMIGGVVAVPVLGLVVEALPVDPSISDRVELMSDAMRNLSLPLLGLLIVGGAGVYLLFRARHLTWWSRAAATALAIMVVIVNAGRAPDAPRPTAQDALPSLLTSTGADVSLGSAGSNIILAAPVRVSRGGAIAVDTAAARRASAAAMASSMPDDGMRQYTMVLHPNATAVHAADRLILRARSASVRTADGTHAFRTQLDETVLAGGDPLPGRDVRWLNTPASDDASLFAFTSRRADAVQPAAPATAEFVVDVERRQPVLLATHPLDGRAPTGPWHPFVGLRVTAPTDSLHTLLVHVNKPTALYTGANGVDRAIQDVTFVLLHETRGEALHLTTDRMSAGSLGWALSPTLIDGVRAGLRPVTTGRDVMHPDSAWLRGASLVMIGWRTVEHGALALRVPVRQQTASRAY